MFVYFDVGVCVCLKTHTMEGPEVDPGVNSRALHELFRCVCACVCVCVLVCLCLCTLMCECVCVSQDSYNGGA